MNLLNVCLSGVGFPGSVQFLRTDRRVSRPTKLITGPRPDLVPRQGYFVGMCPDIQTVESSSKVTLDNNKNIWGWKFVHHPTEDESSLLSLHLLQFIILLFSIRKRLEPLGLLSLEWEMLR